MGSFLAASVAYGLTADELPALIIETDQILANSELFRKRSILVNLLAVGQGNGLVVLDKLTEVVVPLHPLYQGVKLSDLSLPIAIPTADLISGRIVIFSNQPEFFKAQSSQTWNFYEGDITVLEACLASSAYPLMTRSYPSIRCSKHRRLPVIPSHSMLI